jgi:hypothetical protein
MLATKEWQRQAKEIEDKCQQRFADLERKFQEHKVELEKQRDEEQRAEDTWEDIMGI